MIEMNVINDSETAKLSNRKEEKFLYEKVHIDTKSQLIASNDIIDKMNFYLPLAFASHSDANAKRAEHVAGRNSNHKAARGQAAFHGTKICTGSNSEGSNFLHRRPKTTHKVTVLKFQKFAFPSPPLNDNFPV